MVTFENLEVNVGEMKKNSTKKIEYIYTGDSSEISAVSPTCGCTANCRKEGDNKIVADFTATVEGPFEKWINVFFTNKSIIKLKIEGVGV